MLMTIATYDRVPPVWAALDRDAGLFGQGRWLATMAPQRHPHPRWLVASEGGAGNGGGNGGGKARGGAAVGLYGTILEEPNPDPSEDLRSLLELGSPFLSRTRSEPSRAPAAAAGATRGTGADWYPSLTLALPGRQWFAVGDGARDARVLTAALEALCRWAAAAGIRAVCALYVDPADEPLNLALTEGGFAPFPVGEEATLAVDGRTYLSLLESRSPKGRAKIRREIVRLAAADLRFDEATLWEAMDDVVRLRCLHKARYGRAAEPERELALFTAIAEGFGEGATVFRATAGDGAVVSFALFLWDRQTWHAMATATDHQHPASDLSYFATMYYEPYRVAHDRGARVISYGLATGEAKRRRGCRLTPLSGWVRTLDPALEPAVAELLATAGPRSPASTGRAPA
jgi:hypothetical protein